MPKEIKTLPSLGGLETLFPADKISDRGATDILNIDMSKEGLIQTKGGYRNFANEISAAGESLRGYRYKKILGTKRDILLRVVDDATNSELQWLATDNDSTADGKWEKLIGGLTQGAVMGFT